MNATSHIRIGLAQNILDAADFAQQTGRTLNKFVTIHWALADGGGDPRQRFGLVQERARHWLKRRGHELAWVWTHEHATSKQFHTHIAAHIPHGLVAPFERKLADWIGGNLADGLLHLRPFDYAGGLPYLLKDTDPDDRADLALDQRRLRAFRRRRSTRKIEGKRCGVSQALGPAARSRWQMVSLAPTAVSVTAEPLAAGGLAA